LQRHRITYIREMDEDELHRAGRGEPTVDRIDIAEFESNEQLQEYLKKARRPSHARTAINFLLGSWGHVV